MLTASAGLLGSMGIAFLLKTTYLLPLMAVALVVAVIGLGFGAGKRHGYGPLAVGILSAVLLLVGRFVVVSDAMMYCGGGMLIVASVWNSWPTKRTAPTAVELRLPCDSLPQSIEN